MSLTKENMEGWRNNNDDMLDDEYRYNQQLEAEYRLMCDDRERYIQQLRTENRQLKEAIERRTKGDVDLDGEAPSLH